MFIHVYLVLKLVKEEGMMLLFELTAICLTTSKSAKTAFIDLFPKRNGQNFKDETLFLIKINNI